MNLRINLKTALILLAILGCGLGWMGRLFYDDYAAFQQILRILCTIVPFLAAIVTILKVGKDAKSGRLLAWGLFLGFMPIAGMIAIGVLSSIGGSSPGGLGFLSNDRLIERRLPTVIDQPWAWQELERRLKNGQLSTEEIDAALGKLTAHLKGKKMASMHLSWQSEFIKATLGKASNEALCDLFDQAFNTPRIMFVDGKYIHVELANNTMASHKLGVERIVKAKGVVVDGKPVKVQLDTNQIGLQQIIEVDRMVNSKSTIEIEMECAYIPTKGLGGINPYDIPAAELPKPLKTWQMTLKNKETRLTLITTALEADPSPHLKVASVKFHSNRQGGKSCSVQLNIDEAMKNATGICAEVFVHVNKDLMIDMGSLLYFNDGESAATSGDLLTGTIDALPDDCTTVDVEFVPDADLSSGSPWLEEMWGKTIMIRNVPVKRLDLNE